MRDCEGLQCDTDRFLATARTGGTWVDMAAYRRDVDLALHILPSVIDFQGREDAERDRLRSTGRADVRQALLEPDSSRHVAGKLRSMRGEQHVRTKVCWASHVESMEPTYTLGSNQWFCFCVHLFIALFPNVLEPDERLLLCIDFERSPFHVRLFPTEKNRRFAFIFARITKASAW